MQTLPQPLQRVYHILNLEDQHIQQLLEEQLTNGKTIENFSNFKKDSANHKTQANAVSEFAALQNKEKSFYKRQKELTKASAS